MLVFSRAGVVRFRLQRRLLSTAAAQVSSTTSPVAPPPRELRKGTGAFNNRRFQGPTVAAEQVQLQQKYKESLDRSKEVNTLFEVVESVEWRGGSVHYFVLNKVSQLVLATNQDPPALSDRQLAVLLSIFGELGDSVPRHQRSDLLDRTLGALEGRGVVLGALARTAVLAASIDNGKVVNVVEELQNWEAAGLTPNEETYEQLARAYALDANTRGVVDIINHMKSSNMVVGESFISSLVHSMARGGHYSQAEGIIAKFSGTMNEVRLRCALAMGAVAKREPTHALSALASIPEKARPNIVQNNKMILEVFFELLETDQMEAAKSVIPYLSTVPDGSVLTDWHHNGYVLARVRRARSEGLLDAALAIYAIINPAYHNSNLEDQLRSTLGFSLRKSDSELEKVFSTAKEMQRMNILSEPEMFLFEASLSSTHFRNVFDRFLSNKNNSLGDLLTKKPELKRQIAKRLSEDLTDKTLTPEQRTAVLAQVATVFFTGSNAEENVADYYPIIYSLSGKDVNLAISTLSLLSDSRINRDCSTAFLQQILRDSSDPLQKEKLEKLLSCDSLQGIVIVRVGQQIQSMVLNKAKKTSEGDDLEQLRLAAKIIGLGFPVGNTPRSKDVHAVKVIVDLLGNELLSDERAALFVECLENDMRVNLTFDDLEAGKKILEQKGLPKRGELLARLKKSSKAFARWQESSVEQLLEELTHLQNRPETKNSKGAMEGLQYVLLRKIQNNKPLDYELGYNALVATKSSSRNNYQSRLFWQDTLQASLVDGRLDVAESLWNIRPNLTKVPAEHPLVYISTLFLGGETERANLVCEQLRESTATITGGSLEAIGRMVGDVSRENISELSAYLKKKFNLKDYQIRRISAQMRMKKLHKLIERGNTKDAFDLACEESSAGGVAFGQFELFAAAFKKNDSELAQNVYNMVVNSHNKTIAILDLAYAMLDAGRNEQAAKLFATNGLQISSRKLEFFVKRAVSLKRPDIIRGLFCGLCEEDRASNVDLNQLLLQLSRLYFKANDMDSLISLEEEVEKRSFPIGQEMRSIFDGLKKNRRQSKAKEEAN